MAIIIDARNKILYDSTKLEKCFSRETLDDGIASINQQIRKISFGSVTIAAVDLITDAWADFQYFLDAAVRHETDGEFALRNRYLRTAMMNLFAHFDGVVSGVCDQLVEEGQIHSRFSEDSQEKCSVKSKFFAIRDQLKNKRNQQLPYVNLDLKPIRDIINHPSVTKPKSGGNSVMITHVDVYCVDIQEVITACKQIDRWLTLICNLTGYQRFINTEEVIKMVHAALEVQGEIKEF